MSKDSFTLSDTGEFPNHSNEPKAVCGIIMPISTIDGLPESHWQDVLRILSKAAVDAGFAPRLVSNSNESTIIQQSIVQNLYGNPIVICDVSGKNPNVMFELGMRLTFDRPTIVIKDDCTDYTFDTSPIRYLEYRRDLRYQNISDFQTTLTARIQSLTQDLATSEHNSYLKTFGQFIVPRIETKEVSEMQYIVSELQQIKRAISKSNNDSDHKSRSHLQNFDQITALGKRIRDLIFKGGDPDLVAALGMEFNQIVAYLKDQQMPITNDFDFQQFVNSTNDHLIRYNSKSSRQVYPNDDKKNDDITGSNK